MYFVRTGFIYRYFKSRSAAIVHFYNTVIQDPALDASFKSKLTKLVAKDKHEQVIKEYEEYIKSKNIKTSVELQEASIDNIGDRAKYILKRMICL